MIHERVETGAWGGGFGARQDEVETGWIHDPVMDYTVLKYTGQKSRPFMREPRDFGQGGCGTGWMAWYAG